MCARGVNSQPTSNIVGTVEDVPDARIVTPTDLEEETIQKAKKASKGIRQGGGGHQDATPPPSSYSDF